MVRLSTVMLKDGISKTLSLSFSDMLVCPLSKQPLRFCEESNSLISDAIGVSFPMVNGIPCLVPKDGKIIDTEDVPKANNDVGISHQESTLRG